MCPAVRDRINDDAALFMDHRVSELKAQGIDGDELMKQYVQLEVMVASHQEEAKQQIATLRTELGAHKAILDATQQRLDNLEKMRVPSSDNTINQQQIAYTVNNTTNNNITINVFGKEDLSHLTPEFLERCIKMEGGGVMEVVKKIHFDPEKPENHNVRITTIKDWQAGLIQFREGKDWGLTDKSATYRDMWLGGWRPMNRVWGDWECDGVTKEKLARAPNAFKVESFMEAVEGICARMNIRAKPDATDEERAKVRAKIDRASKDLRKIFFKPMEALLRTEYIKRKQAEADTKKPCPGPRSHPIAAPAGPEAIVAQTAPLVAPAAHMEGHVEEEEDLEAFMAQVEDETSSESDSEPDCDTDSEC
jgi:hypothetical protein